MTRLIWLVSLVTLLCTIVVVFYRARGGAEVPLPPYVEVRAAYRPSDVGLLDRQGEILHEVRLDRHGRRLSWTPLSVISPALQAAVIASEDRRFHRHGGVDVVALLASVARRLAGQPLRGASTISMQLITLIHPELRARGRSRTVAQKWQQIWLAWGLERVWSKAEILEAYLNLVSYRGELQGIAAATSGLFGKAPHGINGAEAAILAVLLRAPNAEPAMVTRRAWALIRALDWPLAYGDLTSTVAGALSARPSMASRGTLAPHVAQRLLRTTHALAPVRSTLDRKLQETVTESLARQLTAIRAQRVYDGAVLVVDNRSGEVLAYVAGSGNLSSARHMDAIQARRQTGSILKPFLYGMAFERRILTPASLLEDEPLEVPVTGGLYRPKNYDERFRGLVTVRRALAASLNIPAVRTLGLVGAETFVQQLRRLGLAGAVESGEYYGPSLALGSLDASLWELVNAYRTLANGGVWGPLRLTPEPPETQAGRRLYSEATAFLLSQILSDRESRSATFGLENSLSTRFWSAVKTGTSQDMRDNWCIGYTGQYTVGVWVGNLSGEPMRHVSGMTGAAPVWLETAAWLHRVTPSYPMAPPAGVLSGKVSAPSAAEPERVEWFLHGTEPAPLARPLAGDIPHIRSPAPEEVIALDPDIPRAHQRLVFEANAAATTLRWFLNGEDLGEAASPFFWEPVPGQHVLSLTDQEQRALETVTFEVRPAVTPVDLPAVQPR
jgi:penicillin-binding protein 1C